MTSSKLRKEGQAVRKLSVPGLCRSGNEGSALVEMAVSLPLIMLIMTGIFSFSIALYQKLQLSNAVGNAGAYLAVDRGDHDPCSTVTNTIYNMTPGLSSKSITVTIVLNGKTEKSSSCPGSGTTAPNSDLAQGTNAQVTASYPTALQVFGSNFSSFNLTSGVTEIVQ